MPLGVVIARSETGAVAVSHAVAYSTGVAFDFRAEARGLGRGAAGRVFHEQHVHGGPDEDLPAALLRLGFELPDGGRVSNLEWPRSRRLMLEPDELPEGPLLMPCGGGGGTADDARVSMRPGSWLWPLPAAGPIRVSCEWPLVGIGLATVELDGGALVAAAAKSAQLWPS